MSLWGKTTQDTILTHRSGLPESERSRAEGTGVGAAGAEEEGLGAREHWEEEVRSLKEKGRVSLGLELEDFFTNRG